MKNESTSVFKSPGVPKPESTQPEFVDLGLKKTELSPQEKMTSLTKQLANLNLVRMAGLTEVITKENFPDVPEDFLEEVCYEAAGIRHKVLMLDAGDTSDPELQKMLKQKAADVERTRIERAKTFFKKTQTESPEIEEQKPTVPSPRKPLPLPYANTGQYL